MTACGTQETLGGRSPTQTSKPSVEAPPSPASRGAISSLLLANFTLLRTPPDGIPHIALQALAGSVPKVRWNLARRIPVSAPSTYWLVPGASNMCVVRTIPGSPSVGAVCASVTQALHHGVANASLDPTSGRRIIVGVVPVGIRVVLVRSGTQTSSAHAFQGSFVLRDSVGAPPDEMTLR